MLQPPSPTCHCLYPADTYGLISSLCTTVSGELSQLGQLSWHGVYRWGRSPHKPQGLKWSSEYCDLLASKDCRSWKETIHLKTHRNLRTGFFLLFYSFPFFMCLEFYLLLSFSPTIITIIIIFNCSSWSFFLFIAFLSLFLYYFFSFLIYYFLFLHFFVFFVTFI